MLHRLLECGRARFICIEKENPGMLNRAVLQCPVPLLTEGNEWMFNNMNARCARDPHRRIRAAGIDQMNVVAPADRLEQPRQVVLFVLRENNDRNAHERGRNTRQGFPAANESGGTSRVTTEAAPTTLRAPIVNPGMTNARAP